MQNKSTLKERLAEFLAHLEIGQAKFGEIVGVSKAFANNVGSSIQEDNLKKISAAYPELNLVWLLMGEGQMLKGETVQVVGRDNRGTIVGRIDGNMKSGMGDKEIAALIAENAALREENRELRSQNFQLTERIGKLTDRLLK